MLFGRTTRKPIAIPVKEVAQWKYTTCNYCSTGCAIEIGLNDKGKIARIIDFWPHPYELPAQRRHLVETY